MPETNFKYRQRIADVLLEEKLDAMGAVLIEGPKACGKTTTAEQHAKSILYLDDPDNINQNLQLAETNIKRLLIGDTPRLIDEWQIAPQLWDAIRFEIDHRKEDGLFMLTGSAVLRLANNASDDVMGNWRVIGRSKPWKSLFSS